MFRRSRRREDSKRASGHASEVERLQGEVQRLERALAEVVAASDDVLIDLKRAQRERAELAQRVAPGFAAAWFTTEPASQGFEDFFVVSEVDKRARKWLLSAN